MSLSPPHSSAYVGRGSGGLWGGGAGQRVQASRSSPLRSPLQRRAASQPTLSQLFAGSPVRGSAGTLRNSLLGGKGSPLPASAPGSPFSAAEQLHGRQLEAVASAVATYALSTPRGSPATGLYSSVAPEPQSPTRSIVVPFGAAISAVPPPTESALAHSADMAALKPETVAVAPSTAPEPALAGVPLDPEPALTRATRAASGAHEDVQHRYMDPEPALTRVTRAASGARANLAALLGAISDRSGQSQLLHQQAPGGDNCQSLTGPLDEAPQAEPSSVGLRSAVAGSPTAANTFAAGPEAAGELQTAAAGAVAAALAGVGASAVVAGGLQAILGCMQNIHFGGTAAGLSDGIEPPARPVVKDPVASHGQQHTRYTLYPHSTSSTTRDPPLTAANITAATAAAITPSPSPAAHGTAILVADDPRAGDVRRSWPLVKASSPQVEAGTVPSGLTVPLGRRLQAGDLPSFQGQPPNLISKSSGLRASYPSDISRSPPPPPPPAASAGGSSPRGVRKLPTHLAAMSRLLSPRPMMATPAAARPLSPHPVISATAVAIAPAVNIAAATAAAAVAVAPPVNIAAAMAAAGRAGPGAGRRRRRRGLGCPRRRRW